MKRYIIAIGKYGTYIFDTQCKHDLTLDNIVRELNSLDILRSEYAKLFLENEKLTLENESLKGKIDDIENKKKVYL